MDPTWRPCFSDPLTRRTFCARPSAKNIGSNVSTEQKMAGNTNCIFAFFWWWKETYEQLIGGSLLTKVPEKQANCH